MLKVTEKAQQEIAEYFKDKERTPIRIFLNSGGWGGPSFTMALDEPKDSDETFEIGNHPYVIDKELLAEAAPVIVDFGGMGYKIDTGMVMPESGCGGCGSAGSC